MTAPVKLPASKPKAMRATRSGLVQRRLSAVLRPKGGTKGVPGQILGTTGADRANAARAFHGLLRTVGGGLATQALETPPAFAVPGAPPFSAKSLLQLRPEGKAFYESLRQSRNAGVTDLLRSYGIPATSSPEGGVAWERRRTPPGGTQRQGSRRRIGESLSDFSSQRGGKKHQTEVEQSRQAHVRSLAGAPGLQKARHAAEAVGGSAARGAAAMTAFPSMPLAKSLKMLPLLAIEGASATHDAHTGWEEAKRNAANQAMLKSIRRSKQTAPVSRDWLKELREMPTETLAVGMPPFPPFTPASTGSPSPQAVPSTGAGAGVSPLLVPALFGAPTGEARPATPDLWPNVPRPPGLPSPASLDAWPDFAAAAATEAGAPAVPVAEIGVPGAPVAETAAPGDPAAPAAGLITSTEELRGLLDVTPSASNFAEAVAWQEKMSGLLLPDAEYRKILADVATLYKDSKGQKGPPELKQSLLKLLGHKIASTAKQATEWAEIKNETFDPQAFVKTQLAEIETMDTPKLMEAMKGFSVETGITGPNLVDRFFHWWRTADSWQKGALIFGLPLAIGGIASSVFGGGSFGSILTTILGPGAMAVGSGVFGTPTEWLTSVVGAGSVPDSPGQAPPNALESRIAEIGQDATTVAPSLESPEAPDVPATDETAVMPMLNKLYAALEEYAPAIAQLDDGDKADLLRWVSYKAGSDPELQQLLQAVWTGGQLSKSNIAGLIKWLSHNADDPVLKSNPNAHAAVKKSVGVGNAWNILTGAAKKQLPDWVPDWLSSE